MKLQAAGNTNNLIAGARTIDGGAPSATSEVAMTAFKNRSQLALPDVDPSIALAQAARQGLDLEFLAQRHAADPLTEQGKSKYTIFLAQLLRRFAALLKSTSRSSVGVTAPARSDA